MAEVEIQPCGFLLELSADWLILRASENVHKFLGEYHVRLVGEPLSDFTMAQPLHDLRNSLSRQTSSTGIARTYRVRLIDEPRHFDIAYQMVDGRILIEGVPASEDGFGAALGSVSRLADELVDEDGQSLLDDAARRMRALTGVDHVTLTLETADGQQSAESSRSKHAPSRMTDRLPAIVADLGASPAALFPREPKGSVADHALLRWPSPGLADELKGHGVMSALNIPVIRKGRPIGCFRCESRTPVEPRLELHAAAELFAQIVAMRLDP